MSELQSVIFAPLLIYFVSFFFTDKRGAESRKGAQGAQPPLSSPPLKDTLITCRDLRKEESVGVGVGGAEMEAQLGLVSCRSPLRSYL